MVFVPKWTFKLFETECKIESIRWKYAENRCCIGLFRGRFSSADHFIFGAGRNRHPSGSDLANGPLDKFFVRRYRQTYPTKEVPVSKVRTVRIWTILSHPQNLYGSLVFRILKTILDILFPAAVSAFL